MFKTLILLFLLIFPHLSVGHELANKSVVLGCAHVQICNIIDEILPQKTSKVTVKMPFQLQGDPHHFEPGPKAIKEMLKVPYLLAPSEHLSSWQKKIIQQRKKDNQLKSHELKLSRDSQRKEVFTNEVWAHFWLYPKSLCRAKKEIESQLISWELIKTSTSISCSFLGLKLLEKKLKKYSKQTPLVLYHDALLPYFLSLGVEAVAIRGSGHAEQVSLSKIKEFHQFLAKHPQVLWVQESSIHIHSQLKGLQRPNDLSVALDTLGKRHESSTKVLAGVLKALVKKLQSQHNEGQR